ncbi:MAG: oligosaccharide flippase family protein [Sphingomonadaceae bacterium]
MTLAGSMPVYRGAFFAVAMQWSVRVIGLVSVVILARLLDPSDFGIVALASSAMALVELLGLVGLRQALLRLREPERAHYDTAWTIQLLLAVGMTLGALLIVAPVAARLYDLPGLYAVIMVLGTRFIFFGLVNIGVVDFERHLQFGRDLKMRVGARFVAFLATIAAAFMLRSYWALVIGLMAYPMMLALASFIVHPYRPRLSLARRGELLGISLWILVSGTAQTVQQQVERLVIGRFALPFVVGLYSVSKDLASIFTEEISTALNRVTFVTVARRDAPLSERSDEVGRVLGAYAMIAAPLGIGLSAVAPQAIPVLLGAKWIEAAPYLQVIAVYSGLYAVYKAISSILQASGMAPRAALLSAAGALATIAAVVGAALVWSEALPIAWAALAAHAVMLVAGIGLLAHVARGGFAAFAVPVVRPFLAALLMAQGIAAIGLDSGSPFIDLAANVALGGALYLAAIWLIWSVSRRPEGAESEFFSLLALVRRGLPERLRAARR